MQEYLSFKLFVHYKGFFLKVNDRQSARQAIKIAARNYVGCESMTKSVCLKCDVFACNRRLKCSVPVSESYPGWNVQKLLCVVNAIRKNTLQNINNKIHQKRKKTKKCQEHQMMLNSLFTALQGDFRNTEKSSSQSLDKN